MKEVLKKIQDRFDQSFLFLAWGHFLHFVCQDGHVTLADVQPKGVIHGASRGVGVVGEFTLRSDP